MFFLILGRFYWKSDFSIWKLSRDDSGRLQNICQSHFGLGNKHKSQFWIPKLKCWCFWKPRFPVFVQIHFLDHKLQDPSCRICSYGPYGPFWFSVNKSLGYWKPLQQNIVDEKNTFLRLSRTWINSLEAYFHKLPYVKKLQGPYFGKRSIPYFFGHANFEEIALLLIFGPSVSPFLAEVHLLVYGASVSEYLPGCPAIKTSFSPSWIFVPGYPVRLARSESGLLSTG